MKKIKTLIVAAYPKELQYLCKLGKKKSVLKGNFAYLASGIGAVPATYNLTQFLFKYKPGHIITLNTAGIINKNKFKIGDVVLAKTLSTSSMLKEVYTPESIKDITLKPKVTLKSLGIKTPKLKTASVFCTQEISSSETMRKNLMKAGHDIETMEAYAYAYVAKRHNIPIVSLLGLSNVIGPKAHDEWLENESWVCEKMSEIVKELLTKLP